MSKCSDGADLQSVVHGDQAGALRRADPVEQQVHGAEPGGRIDDLPAAERLVAEEPLLVRVERA